MNSRTIVVAAIRRALFLALLVCPSLASAQEFSLRNLESNSSALRGLEGRRVADVSGSEQQVRAADRSQLSDSSLGTLVSVLSLDADRLRSAGVLDSEPLVFPAPPTIEFEAMGRERRFLLVERIFDWKFSAYHLAAVDPITGDLARLTVSAAGSEIVGTLLLDHDRYRLFGGRYGDNRQLLYPIKPTADTYERDQPLESGSRIAALEGRHLQLGELAMIQPEDFDTAADGRLTSIEGGDLGRVDLLASYRVAADGKEYFDREQLEQEVESYLHSKKTITGVGDGLDLAIEFVRTDGSFSDGVLSAEEWTTIKVFQRIGGIIVDAPLGLVMDPLGNIISIGGMLVRQDMVDHGRRRWLVEADAMRVAGAAVSERSSGGYEIGTSELIYRFVSADELLPFWRFEIRSREGIYLVLVDALTGETGVYDGLLRASRACLNIAFPPQSTLGANDCDVSQSDHIPLYREDTASAGFPLSGSYPSTVCEEPPGTNKCSLPDYKDVFEQIPQIYSDWISSFGGSAALGGLEEELEIVFDSNIPFVGYSVTEDTIFFTTPGASSQLLVPTKDAKGTITHELFHRYVAKRNPYGLATLSITESTTTQAVMEALSNVAAALYLSTPTNGPDWQWRSRELDPDFVGGNVWDFNPSATVDYDEFSDFEGPPSHPNASPYKNARIYTYLFYSILQHPGVSEDDLSMLLARTSERINPGKDGDATSVSNEDLEDAIAGAAASMANSSVASAVNAVWNTMDGSTGAGGGTGGTGGGVGGPPPPVSGVYANFGGCEFFPSPPQYITGYYATWFPSPTAIGFDVFMDFGWYGWTYIGSTSSSGIAIGLYGGMQMALVDVSATNFYGSSSLSGHPAFIADQCSHLPPPWEQ